MSVEGSFFQDLAEQIDKASTPIRAMYHTGPNLAEYVQAAKAAGIKTVSDVTRVGRRAMEDIRERLAEEPGFKDKERLFRAIELEFKAVEDALREAEREYRITYDIRALRSGQQRFKEASEAWGEGRREVSLIRRRAVLRVLRSGGVALGGEPFQWQNTSREVQAVFSKMSRLVPRSWIEALNHAPMVGAFVSEERDSGFYPGNRRKPGRIVIGGSSRFIRDESALHEMLHPIELAMLELREMARRFRRERLSSGGFADSYLGREPYSGGGTEIVATGLESVYFSTRRTWSEDDELLEFLIGAMLTL